MNAPSSRNTLWDAHIERVYRISDRLPADATTSGAANGAPERDDAQRTEWTARPPGPLGRRLLADVEPYLAFFAIAALD